MAVSALLMVSLMGASAVSSEATRWFPGGYFDSRVKDGFQGEVMESWPGPSQLLRLWSGGGLNESDQVSLLLGGAAFHDPVLLPAYRDAVISPSPRVRQAAVYGYRDLLGDGLPDVSVGINSEASALLAEEMEWMMRTLSRRTVVELWLQALLAHEDRGLPGWQGVTLERDPNVSLHAIERVLHIEDLKYLLDAYDISQDFSSRVNLLELIEAITLSRFINVPEGGKKGWGRQVYETAMGGLEGARRQWSAASCVVDGEAVLESNLKAMGVTGVDALSEAGCQVWVNVLERGAARWWMLASRRLYECGGPWFTMSALSPGGSRDKEHRSRLLEWFKPLRPDQSRSTRR